jgi:hypothetical protein
MNAKNPQLASEGFTCLAGPYLADERWMLDAAVSDARRANKEIAIDHNHEGQWIWQRRTRA